MGLRAEKAVNLKDFIADAAFLCYHCAGGARIFAFLEEL